MPEVEKMCGVCGGSGKVVVGIKRGVEVGKKTLNCGLCNPSVPEGEGSAADFNMPPKAALHGNLMEVTINGVATSVIEVGDKLYKMASPVIDDEESVTEEVDSDTEAEE